MNTDRHLLREFENMIEKDEQIQWVTKPKPVPLLYPFLPMVIMSIFGAIFYICNGFKLANISSVILNILFILTPFLFFLTMHVLYSKQLYAFSQKRIIIRYGFIKPYFKTIEYDEIIESEMKINILDKICHTGSITFFTGETREIQGGKKKVYYYWRAIENPHEVFDKVKQISGDAKNQSINPVHQKTTMTLNNIAWNFSEEFYTDAIKFNQDVTQYQENIYKDRSRWVKDEIVIEEPEIQIQYMAWVYSPEDLLDNERLIEEDEDVFDEEVDEDGYQVEILSILKADNGKYFTALEFLMKVHNQQANKELGDHVFFEGIDETPEITDGLPTYYIACGS